MSYYFALILTVVGTLLYHLAQKTIPPTVSPFGLLATAFATALKLCLKGFDLHAKESGKTSAPMSNAKLTLTIKAFLMSVVDRVFLSRPHFDGGNYNSHAARLCAAVT